MKKIFPMPTDPNKLWDCDVALPEFKIAILWNGLWHYQEVKGASLKQTQTRDRIKLQCIEAAGYTPYIIKDMGKYNPKFVEEEFGIFLQWFGVLFDLI